MSCMYLLSHILTQCIWGEQLKMIVVQCTSNVVDVGRALNQHWVISSICWDKGDLVMSHYPALSRDPISSHACVPNSYRTNHQRVIRSRLCGDGCHVFLSEAVYGWICFSRKIQHGGDWEQSRPQGPKNVHNFLMTVRPLSWACGHGAEMLLILKKLFLTWLLPDIFRYDSPKKCPTILYVVNMWLKHWGYGDWSSDYKEY